MNNVNRRFIAMPDFCNLKKQNLKTLDVLVYVTIRSFHNSKNGLCYPSYEKIMEKSGLSRGTIAASIKRLEAARHFKVVHSNRQGTCNQYIFDKLAHFQRVPYEVFDATDLTTNEKGLLLCLRPLFINEILSCIGDVKTLAKQLGLTYNQLYKPYRSLILKGYLTEKTKSYTTLYLKGKINWEYDYVDKSLPEPELLKVKITA